MRSERAPVGGLAQPLEIALPALPAAPVRNVVVLVGDGMGIAQSTAARLRAFGLTGRFVWERFPEVGLVDTRPAAGVVAKSDAAATAFATGTRTANGRVGEDPSRARLVSWLAQAHAAGWRTGVVTSSEIVDATPAAFYAHVPRRHDEPEIAQQLAVSGIDFVAGGGRRWFERAATGGRTLLDELRERGVPVVDAPDAMARAQSLPLWALFPGSTLGEQPPHPTVGEMTAKALALLAAASRDAPHGFVLVAEEEGLDTAGHARDLGRMTAAALRLDAAVAEAARFAAADGRTLVLVFGDHSTGALAIDQGSTASELRVLWGSDVHAGEPVPIYAYGPESALAPFRGLLDNTAIATRIRALLDLPEPGAS